MKFGSFYAQWVIAHILGWLLALSISGLLVPLGFSMWSSLVLVIFMLTACQIFIALPIRSNWKYVIIFAMNAVGCFSIMPAAAPIFVVMSGMKGSIAETILFLAVMGTVYGAFTGAPLVVLISRQNAEDEAAERAKEDLLRKQEAKHLRAHNRSVRLSAVNMARAERLYRLSRINAFLARKDRSSGDDFGEDLSPEAVPGSVELPLGDTFDLDIPDIPEDSIRSRYGERLLAPDDETIEDG